MCINLSRSGLGTSFGVRGARIGVGPRGTYVHVGRGGLYYRQSLGVGNNNGIAKLSPNQNPAIADSDGLKEIESTTIDKLVDASSESMLAELNRVKKYTELFPIVLILIGVEFFSLYYFKAPQWSYYIGSVISAAILIFTRHFDVTNGTAILRYDLEPDAGSAFEAIKSCFENIIACSRVWHIEAAGDQGDWKRHGGANQTVRRKIIVPSLSVPPRVQSNIKVPTLFAGQQTIYFFPERVLVYESKGVGAVSYKDLEIDRSNTRFIEGEWVPHDAKVIDKTWQYVNKSGGPDRRFSNNREIPVVQYEEMHLKSSTGLNELFMLSKLESTQGFVKSLAPMNSLQATEPKPQ